MFHDGELSVNPGLSSISFVSFSFVLVAHCLFARTSLLSLTHNSRHSFSLCSLQMREGTHQPDSGRVRGDSCGQVPLDGRPRGLQWPTVLWRDSRGLQVRRLGRSLHVHGPTADPGQTSQRAEGLQNPPDHSRDHFLRSRLDLASTNCPSRLKEAWTRRRST